MPMLSVVVPFYDVEDYIEECLESLRTQLLHDIEVILVDDGSRDGSRAIADRFVETDPRFTLVAQENAGLGPARNAGAARAAGTYLAFIDSDDIVPARGLWALVTSLEGSGSDFAAGNARRFTRARGSYQSWSHAEAFARPGRRVTIGERPELAKDRMVWNKVYRRSFWQQHDLEFPPIRYEDYPVTLRAYLEADAVDVLSEHVYYWRDRESGTSITQQTADVRNAVERYASASLVLDVLDTHPAAAPAVRGLVETTFARVDLVSMAQTYAAAPSGDRAELADMMIDLARRLTPDPALPQTRTAQLVRTALLRGDLALVEAVGARRGARSLRGLAGALATTRSVPSVTRLVAAAAPRPSGLAWQEDKPLRSRLDGVEATDDGLTLTISTSLRDAFARVTEIEAAVENGEHSVALPLTIARRGRNRLTLTVAVSNELLRGLPDEPFARVVLRVRARGGVLRWRGVVDVAPDALPGPLMTRVGLFQVTDDEGLGLRPLADDVPVMRGELSEGATGPMFSVTTPDNVRELVVMGRDPLPPHAVSPHTSGQGTPTCSLELEALFSDDRDDDPVARTSLRPLGVRRGTTDVEPVLLDGDPVEASLHDGSRVRLTRDAFGRAVLLREAKMPSSE